MSTYSLLTVAAVCLACGTLTSGASIFGDPKDIFAGWSPMGYFNQFYDPSNVIGPEILKTFGVPYAPYNGFNLLETGGSLEVPAEATSPIPPGYEDYEDIFYPPAPNFGGSSYSNAAFAPSPAPVNVYPVQPPPMAGYPNSAPPPQQYQNPSVNYGSANSPVTYFGSNNGNDVNGYYYANSNPNQNYNRRTGYFGKGYYPFKKG